jgi:hypothetical protein
VLEFLRSKWVELKIIIWNSEMKILKWDLEMQLRAASMGWSLATDSSQRPKTFIVPSGGVSDGVIEISEALTQKVLKDAVRGNEVSQLAIALSCFSNSMEAIRLNADQRRLGQISLPFAIHQKRQLLLTGTGYFAAMHGADILPITRFSNDQKALIIPNACLPSEFKYLLTQSRCLWMPRSDSNLGLQTGVIDESRLNGLLLSQYKILKRSTDVGG